jgi:hypothetical protein
MTEWNPTQDELDALRKEYASGATIEQFKLWIAMCKHRRLQPVTDIVLQVRKVSEYDPDVRAKIFKSKAIYITTIGALRRLAERTGKYGGVLPAEWVYLDKENNPTITSPLPLPDPNDPKKIREPYAAIARVIRKDFEKPIQGIARFRAYCQTYRDKEGVERLNQTWANRGPEQLFKCSEADAYRRAYPEETAGFYLEEEIRDENEQKEQAPPAPSQPAPTPTATPAPVNQEVAQGTDAPRPEKEQPTTNPEPDKPKTEPTETKPEEPPQEASPEISDKLKKLKKEFEPAAEKVQYGNDPLPDSTQKKDFTSTLLTYIKKYSLDKNKVRVVVCNIGEVTDVKKLSIAGWKKVLEKFAAADTNGEAAIKCLMDKEEKNG